MHPMSLVADIPMIGRQVELARILNAWDNARRSSGRVILLAGEPGVGKTRLATEALGHIAGGDAYVLIGRAFEQHSSIPFYPFTEAFSMAPPELAAESAQRWPELAHIIPDLVEPTGPAPAEGPDSQGMQLRIYRGALAFMRELCARRPTAVLFDDLHWADSTSLNLLLYVVRHIGTLRLLIVGTYRDVELGRDHPLDASLRELSREQSVEEIQLRGLTREQTGELIRARIGPTTDELVRLMQERTAGNPFFTEELLKAQPEGPAPRESDIPRSIRSAIGGRVAKLSAGARDSLHLASVLGQEFELDLLIAASGRTEDEVFDHLDSALAAGVIAPRFDRPHARYHFTHALIQQTLYSEIPVHRRRRLHQRAGEELEARRETRPVLAGELARHFGEAGDVERAIRYAVDAGDQAASRFAHAEAVRNYEIAIDLLQGENDQALLGEVLRRSGDELYDLNRLTEALAAYDDALARFKQLGDRAGQAFVHRSIGRLHQGRYDVVKAIQHLDAALSLGPVEREDAELTLLLIDAARARRFAGDAWAVMESLVERAMAVAERLGDRNLIARALLEQRSLDARPTARLELQDRAEALARSVDDWRLLHRVYLDRATSNWLAGHLQRALADRATAAEAAERVGETERVSFAYRTMAATHLLLGSWEQGRVFARKSLELDPDALLDRQAELLLAWMEGRHADALDRIPALIAESRHHGDLQGLTTACGWFADFAVQLGRAEEAEALIREAEELVHLGTGRFMMAANVLGQLAETVAQVGRRDSDSVIEDTERQVHASEQYLALPAVLRARALWLNQHGRTREALEVIAESIRVARTQQAKVQLARSLFVQAELARACDETDLARKADAGRRALAEQIGPEVRGLRWATGLTQGGPGQAGVGNQLNPLSPREQEVAALISAGRSNRQIAEALVISERTAEKHVSAILSKLGFDARAQIAAWAVEQRQTRS